MFNGAVKAEAMAALKAAQGEYENETRIVGDAAARLFELRRAGSEHIITQVEDYVSCLANSPKEFDKSVGDYRIEYKAFNDIVVVIEREAAAVSSRVGSGAVAGVATGVGVAALAPGAAMAVATTFGTASTGAAISALSGAAATNAALAWLGGGVVATGGGGMVAGEALLALAGPVGWVIGGTALVAAGAVARQRNRSIAQDAAVQTRKILREAAALASAKAEIGHLSELTETHVGGMMGLLFKLRREAPRNYLAFAADHKDWLAALINHVHSLSELLNRKVGP